MGSPAPFSSANYLIINIGWFQVNFTRADATASSRSNAGKKPGQPRTSQLKPEQPRTIQSKTETHSAREQMLGFCTREFPQVSRCGLFETDEYIKNRNSHFIERREMPCRCVERHSARAMAPFCLHRASECALEGPRKAFGSLDEIPFCPTTVHRHPTARKTKPKR